MMCRGQHNVTASTLAPSPDTHHLRTRIIRIHFNTWIVIHGEPNKKKMYDTHPNPFHGRDEANGWNGKSGFTAAGFIALDFRIPKTASKWHRHHHQQTVGRTYDVHINIQNTMYINNSLVNQQQRVTANAFFIRKKN